MRYRKLSATNDYVFGQSQLDFYVDNVQAVAQSVFTRLRLFQGTFWRALNAGIPMYQQILNTPGTAANLAAVDSIIQGVISGTNGVTNILSYSSAWDSVKRQYSYSSTISTIFSENTVITGVF